MMNEALIWPRTRNIGTDRDVAGGLVIASSAGSGLRAGAAMSAGWTDWVGGAAGIVNDTRGKLIGGRTG